MLEQIKSNNHLQNETLGLMSHSTSEIISSQVELVWRSGSVMDCNTPGSITGGNSVKNQASHLSQGTVNEDAVSK